VTIPSPSIETIPSTSICCNICELLQVLYNCWIPGGAEFTSVSSIPGARQLNPSSHNTVTFPSWPKNDWIDFARPTNQSAARLSIVFSWRYVEMFAVWPAGLFRSNTVFSSNKSTTTAVLSRSKRYCGMCDHGRCEAASMDEMKRSEYRPFLITGRRWQNVWGSTERGRALRTDSRLLLISCLWRKIRIDRAPTSPRSDAWVASSMTSTAIKSFWKTSRDGVDPKYWHSNSKVPSWTIALRNVAALFPSPRSSADANPSFNIGRIASHDKSKISFDGGTQKDLASLTMKTASSVSCKLSTFRRFFHTWRRQSAIISATELCS